MCRGCTGWLLLVAFCAHADSTPKASPHDQRIGIVDYVTDDVYTIAVSKGVLTRIVLGEGEQIMEAGSGFIVTCEVPSEWCIKAEKGQNQIWVKPLSAATSNNMELKTTRGDYSFRFVVAPGAEEAKNVFYRVIFRHPVALQSGHFALVSKSSEPLASASESAPLLAVSSAAAPLSPRAPSASASAAASVTQALPLTAIRPAPTSKVVGLILPAVRNYDYSRKNAPDAIDLAPSVVFDDGRFTYFRFEKAQEVPTVFAVGADGQEIRVATHSERLAGDPQRPNERVESDYLVVQRVARKLVLRLGALVIEVINNKFDARGIETYNGTTTEALVREDKQ
jgi:type IV secretion system protein VirB9